MVIERTEDIEKRKKTALFGVFVFLCVTILLLFLFSLDYTDPPLIDQKESIIVELETAGGLAGGGSSQSSPSTTSQVVTPPSEKVMSETEPKEDKVVSSPVNGTSSTPSNDKPAETAASGFPSFEGMSGNGSGNSSGNGNGDEQGTGSGVSGTGGPGVNGLSGGRIVQKLPPFDWEDVAGYIDILIVFNPDGSAKSASYNGGNISDASLREKCRQQALKARATPISGSQLEKYKYRFNFTSN